jgi:Icc-related predicted phosphoesterase
MKIQIASDLHLEYFEKKFPGYRAIEPADADLLVLAGDIHRHIKAVDTFHDWPVPVVYVSGNHELYYGANVLETVEQLRKCAINSNVHYLEMNDVVLQGVRFLGCCLWTDYRLFHGMKSLAMREAEQCLKDHQLISTGKGTFTAAEAERLHKQSRRWLERKLAEPFTGKTVVVTHHAPHPRSIHPRFIGNLLNASFVSDLTPLVEMADLWIHGHVHDSFDYVVGRTRVVANPRGYAFNWRTAITTAELQWENLTFNPTMVTEI